MINKKNKLVVISTAFKEFTLCRQALKLNSWLLENKQDYLWIPCSELTVAHPESLRVGRLSQAGVPVILLGNLKPRALCHQDHDSTECLPKLIHGGVETAL